MKTQKVLASCLSLLLLAAAGCAAAHATPNAQAGNTLSNRHEEQSVSVKTKTAEPFADFGMTGTGIEYAITKDFRVVKTEDGWNHTVDLLSLEPFADYVGNPALDVFQDKAIHVAAFLKTGIDVEQSVDAGKSWAKSVIPVKEDDSGYGGSLSLSFVSPSEGFLLSCGPPAGGMMGKVLYRTSDGGKSWGKVDGERDSAAKLSKIDGYPTGITFFDSEAGIITCTYHGGTRIPVYRSTDSGKSWKAVPVSLPARFSSSAGREYYADAYPPAAYGPSRKNARLELVFCSDNERIPYVYRSGDRGASWKIDGQSDRALVKYTFADEKNGAGLDESGICYTTHDGGLTWLQ